MIVRRRRMRKMNEKKEIYVHGDSNETMIYLFIH